MHRPLLAPGIHACTFDDIERVCITPFTGASRDRRTHLLHRLRDMLDIFDADFGLSYEVWMDGSYLSDKPEPGDIDCACLLEPVQLNSIPVSKHDSFRKFTQEGMAKARFGIDAYFVPNDADSQIYWRGLFLMDRDRQPKGFYSILRP